MATGLGKSCIRFPVPVFLEFVNQFVYVLILCFEGGMWDERHAQ